MSEVNSCSDYVVIASLFSSDKINVQVSFKGENTPENLYLLNEFPYDKNDTRVFKILFSIFESKDRPSEFEDFFVKDDKFYAVFKYTEAENILQRYQTETCTAPFEDRCKILENILVKTDAVNKFSPEIVACVTEQENIKVDNDRNIYFTYNLKNISKYQGANKKTLFKHIHDIIFTFLTQESRAGFNKQLHIVLDKCENCVYSSIPELIVELKKAEKISKASSWFSYIKYQLSLRKPLINKLIQGTLTATVVAAAIYLGYTKINEGRQADAAAAAVSIGDITYNGNANDESNKKVTTENEDNQTSTKSASDVTLSEGLDMEYEDYIVQYGDTVSSVCESYYKDSKYVTAVATFNGIEANTKLTAGSILKLPNRTAIALYASK